MNELECPYCGYNQEYCGDSLAEDDSEEVQCEDCEKYYNITVSYTVHYYSHKADCLNGSDHRWKSQFCVPIEYTDMECLWCYKKRKPTEEEWVKIKEGRS